MARQTGTTANQYALAGKGCIVVNASTRLSGFRSKTRHPEIGDLLVAKTRGWSKADNAICPRTCIGLIYKFRVDRFGGKYVFVEWQTKAPADYNPNRGFCATNIHNLRNEFRIFRDGEEML